MIKYLCDVDGGELKRGFADRIEPTQFKVELVHGDGTIVEAKIIGMHKAPNKKNKETGEVTGDRVNQICRGCIERLVSESVPRVV